MQSRVVPRYAHTPGLTKLAYSYDGNYVITTGSNKLIRIFRSETTNEPISLETRCGDGLINTDNDILSLRVSKNGKIATSSNDGSIALYSLNTNEFITICATTSLSCWDIDFSPDGEWLALASDDLKPKIINLFDDKRSILFNYDFTSSVRTISFNSLGNLIATTDLEGNIRIFSISQDKLSLISFLKKSTATLPIDPFPLSSFNYNNNKSVNDDDYDDDDDDDDNFSQNTTQNNSLNLKKNNKLKTILDPLTYTRVVWHPDCTSFIVTSPDSQSLQIYHRGNTSVASSSSPPWSQKGALLTAEHNTTIHSVTWSPNGKYLASADASGKILIWDMSNKSVINTYSYPPICQLEWHPKQNKLSFTTIKGQLFTLSQPVPEEFEKISPPYGSLIVPIETKSKLSDTDKLFLSEAESDSDMRNDDDLAILNDVGDVDDIEIDVDQDDLNDDEAHDKEDDWIVDDDNAGYKIPKKRNTSANSSLLNNRSKRLGLNLEFPYHHPFQPGSTPWNENRRYLTVNLVGYVWAQNQGSHNSITVTFFDEGLHNEYYFTDQNKYDLASLTEDGLLLATSSELIKDKSKGEDITSALYYRNHSVTRGSWAINFMKNDSITNIALSSSCIIVSSQRGYVRVYSLQGVPLRIFRQSLYSIVTIACNDDIIFLLKSNNQGELFYSLENISTDETLQKNDLIEINYNSRIISCFFSDNGDPCIFDSDGVLSVLLHWRLPLQGKWVPILDTSMISNDDENNGINKYYWPIGISDNKFHCIILRGKNKYPGMPFPVSSELDLHLPFDTPQRGKKVNKKDNEDDDDDADEENDAIIENNNNSKNEELDVKSKNEEEYVRQVLFMNLWKESLGLEINGKANIENLSIEERKILSQKELNVDKCLLQLFQLACKGGNNSRAVSIGNLINKDGALQAASKIALRFGLTSLANRMNDIRDERGV